ncbi:death-associated inhibitor of apoptosis 1-like [Aphis craccivora]|uniref:Death-associated inhibitor of apoptosis 1-like n=1 Tax=Aphis craccivora TaxID=307492 RepID=A0A6G0Y9F3_APHCR|nr:death-associated inhibitor of apoptosis 1-like [Aphis craccivora]
MCVIHDVLSVPKKGNILRMKRVSQQQINENGKLTTKPLMKNATWHPDWLSEAITASQFPMLKLNNSIWGLKHIKFKKYQILTTYDILRFHVTPSVVTTSTLKSDFFSYLKSCKKSRRLSDTSVDGTGKLSSRISRVFDFFNKRDGRLGSMLLLRSIAIRMGKNYEVWQQHAMHNPECVYVLLYKGAQFIENVKNAIHTKCSCKTESYDVVG